jgi:CBS-domain-containing membrane protein
VKVNEHGEVEIPLDVEQVDSQLASVDVDPQYFDRLREIEQRASEREQRKLNEAEVLSKQMDFDDMTKAFQAYEPVGSAKGIKAAVKKGKKKAA